MTPEVDGEEIKELAERSTKINQNNYQYYQRHFDQLQEKYAGEIVAVHDRQVLAATEFTGDLNDIEAFVEGIKDEHGADVAEAAYITHIPDPNQQLIL